ncbi:50S ribosomal protein L25/general stress protein Ctc [Endothiovibrio diazotrophicus]
MAISFDVNAESRNDMGKGASRRLRRQGKVPAIIYGGSGEPRPISVLQNEMIQHLDHEAFYSHILKVVVDGKAEKAVLRDVQRHPFKIDILHMDFQRVGDGDTIKMHVPLHFTNEEIAVGVKQGGGQVRHNLVEVEVACQAKDLPEFIEVDLTDLGLGESIHLSNLKLPEGVELVELSHGEDHDLPVVSIQKGRGAAAEGEGEGEEGAEG